jgi:hypothetical protein
MMKKIHFAVFFKQKHQKRLPGICLKQIGDIRFLLKTGKAANLVK